MTKAYRHGEIAFLKISKLPKGLIRSKTDIIVSGSHGNNHTFKGGKLYLLPELKDYTLGYFQAKNSILYHPEHGDKNGEANLPNGSYEIRKQQEYTPSGLVPIID